MKKFLVTILYSALLLNCNNVLVAGPENGTNNNISANVTVNNYTSSQNLNIEKLIDDASATLNNAMFNIQIDDINTIINSNIINNDNSNTNNNWQVRILSKSMAELDVLKQKLIEISNNLHIDTDNYTSVFDIFKEICDNQFKDALQNNNLNKLDDILFLATFWSEYRLNTMQNSFNKIQSITEENKQKLKNCIKQCKDIYINIDKQIKLITPSLEYLNVLSFPNNNVIEEIKNKLTQINKNVLDYLGLKKSCLQQLGINLAIANI